MDSDTVRLDDAPGPRVDSDVPPLRRRWRSAVPYVVVVVGWLLVLPFVRHYVNADGTSYVVVAQHWWDGDWAAAVNGYWGPLLSWAAAPLIGLGVPGILALRLVLLAGALLTLGPLRSLSRRAGASAGATDALLLAVAPFLVYNALFGLYPDVLMAAALLRCCDHLFRPEFLTRPATGVVAGLWGGVAYLAKAYAVPVVLVLIPVALLVHRWSGAGPRVRTRSRPPLWRQGLLVLAGFAVLVGGWSAVLTSSYSEPTFSTSAGFNARLVAPGSAGNPFNHPGLHPPEGSEVSAWVEPSTLPVPQRNEWDDAPGPTSDVGTPDPVAERIGTAWGNARIVVGSMVRRGLPVVALAAFAVGWCVRRRLVPPPALTGTLAAGAVSAGGLLPIIAIERYLWFPVLACVPAAAVGLDRLVGSHARRRAVVAGAVVAVMTVTSLHGLLPRWGVDRDVTAAAAELREQGGLDGPAATTGGRWGRSLLLCLEVGCQYLGRPVADDADGAAAELAEAGVEHLLVWDADTGDVTGLPPARGPGVLTVYDVTPEGLVLDRRVGGTADGGSRVSS